MLKARLVPMMESQQRVVWVDTSPYTVEQSLRICGSGEESVFIDRAALLDTNEVTSLRSAVDYLNAGVAPCPEGFCIVWSASKQAYFVLYRGHSKDIAFQQLGISNDEDDTPYDIEQTYCLGANGEAAPYLSQATLLDSTSISESVDLLNRGLIECPDPYCVIYSATKRSYFVLYRSKSRERALKALGVEILTDEEREARRLAAEEEARRLAEEEARRLAEEEARRLAAEEEARRLAEEEARRLAAEEEARRLAEEEARRLAEEEARRLAEEAAARELKVPEFFDVKHSFHLPDSYEDDDAWMDNCHTIDSASSTVAMQQLNDGELPPPPDGWGAAWSASANKYVIVYKPSAKEKAFAYFGMPPGASDGEETEGDESISSSSSS